MPLKTHTRHQRHQKHPKHYAKVYWPYMPLLLIVAMSLYVGQSFVARSQRGVLAYATEVSRSSLLESTNSKRNGADQSQLSLDPALNRAAQAKAQDMVARNYWSHNTPENKAPWVFIEKTDYDYQKAGENLAYGFLTSSEAINGWMNSPSHRENLLDSAYTEVGFGIANSEDYLGQGPETVIVAMYARPSNAPKLSQTTPSISFNTAEPNQLPVASDRQLVTEPSVKAVSKLQSLSDTAVPGITFLIGLLSGVGLAYLVLKHSIGLKRAVRNGEKFVLHHPLLDLTIVSFIALWALLNTSVGMIR